MSIKNFDMVFIYRDFANFKRISSIPMEQLDQIKDWLNESDVLYTEGPIPLNWTTVLAQIRSDIENFIDNGGWRFLMEDAGDQTDGEDSAQGTDSNFDESEELEALGSQAEESSDSGGSDASLDSDDGESSSVQTDEAEEAELGGMDWDEMERKTIEKENR